MTLIKSVSGIRGTIGGYPEQNLTPLDIIEMTAAFGLSIRNQSNSNKIIIGRDARISGEMVSQLCVSTLIALGFDVLDAGLSTTPSIEMGVNYYEAAGGIIITASHNPKEWNALKFLNSSGEFISEEEGKRVISLAKSRKFEFSSIDNIGKVTPVFGLIERHIQDILSLQYVNKTAIVQKKYKIVVDCINSTGSISVVPLLESLQCEVIAINNDLSGNFSHNPEPLPENLTTLSDKVLKEKADLGISVDPDVDRLSFICHDGSMFGEENTIISIAKYLLTKENGNTVSNLSSSRGLKIVTESAKGTHYYSKVGEVHVVKIMKEQNAIIGGEGNGGVIYPKLHYGRDALVGIALFLSALAEASSTVLEYKKLLPELYISKNKIELKEHYDVQNIIKKIVEKYKEEKLNSEDGIKIDFESGWVQLRISNTEPIVRVYSEAKSVEDANHLALKIINDFVYFSEKLEYIT